MRRVRIDPEARITDLVGRLTDDSKRLVRDEVRLAKLELSESTHLAGKGATWLALAFGVGVVAMVAFTILLATALGRLVGDLWAGAMIAAAIELGLGIWLVMRGVRDLREPPYTLEESRAELKKTAAWVAGERAD
jgi:hypothetical protein